MPRSEEEEEERGRLVIDQGRRASTFSGVDAGAGGGVAEAGPGTLAGARARRPLPAGLPRASSPERGDAGRRAGSERAGGRAVGRSGAPGRVGGRGTDGQAGERAGAGAAGARGSGRAGGRGARAEGRAGMGGWWRGEPAAGGARGGGARGASHQLCKGSRGAGGGRGERSKMAPTAVPPAAASAPLQSGRASRAPR